MAVYRHGEMRDCSLLWSDFWFCMRTMHAGLEVGAVTAAVRARAGERMAEMRVKGRSSEDVWKIRAVMVEEEEGTCEKDLKDVWPRLTTPEQREREKESERRRRAGRMADSSED